MDLHDDGRPEEGLPLPILGAMVLCLMVIVAFGVTLIDEQFEPFPHAHNDAGLDGGT